MAKLKKNDEQGLPSLSLVFGYIAIKDLQRLEDRVTVLSRLGYGANEIASICGTTAASVHTLRNIAKNRKILGRTR